MKKILVFLIIFIGCSQIVISQNATSCQIADPFCTGLTYGFPMNTNTSAQPGPNYACLCTQPNPVWYYLKILNPGNITIYLNSPTGNDIDFICWGPFNSPTAPCVSQLTANCSGCSNCPNNTVNPSFYPSGNTVDCSYDPAEFEYVHISNAQTGQYYLLCITNYSNQPGNIVFSQSNAGQPGAGSTDCSIVTPCDITGMTANPSACNPSNNNYSVSGTITFHDAPTTGQLVITDGSSTVTYNPPFNSPINYTINNLNSNGAQHSVTATFTGDQTCTYMVTYNAPNPCNQCSANAGADFSTCGLSATLSAITNPGDYNTSWSCSTPGVVFTPQGSPNATVTVPSSGTYTFTWTITNSFGVTCSDQVVVTFTQTPVASFTATPLQCYGQASTITFTGSATSSASFNWNFGSSANVQSGSGSGPYSVTWTNAGTINISLQVIDNHCPSNTATVTLNQPPQLIANVNVSPVTCASGTNGSVNISVQGGTPSYSYQWSNTTGPPFPAGTYSVTITDQNLCSISYPFTVTEPNPIVVVPNQTNLTCYQNNTGSATVNVSGGTSPYSYSWTNNVSTTNSANNLSAGNYTVSIYDANLCLVTQTFQITEPQPIAIQAINTINPTCAGQCNGSIQINVSGGTPPGYNYQWSNGSNSQNPASLCSGNYTVTVSDANNCTSTQQFTLIDPPSLIAQISNTTHILCNGQCNGSATVSTTNGTPPYAYAWSNFSNNQTASNLCAGNYTVTVYDANTCSATTSVTINQPPQLNAQVSNIQATQCYGDCNGSATITVTGGIPPYQYTWPNSNVNLPINNSLCAGTHMVTVTDANSCTTTAAAMVPQPSELIITNILTTNLTCNGSNNGSIQVNITGGVGTWYFSIPGITDTTGTFTNLAAGIYTVTVTDSRGCSKTGSATITEPSPVVVTGQTYYSVCNGEWVYPSVSAQGGTYPHTFYWNGQQGSNTIGLQPTQNTTYTVSATDANNCPSNTLTINIAVSAPLVVDVTANPNAVCPGQPVELTPLMFAGGGPPYMITTETGTVVTPPIIIYPQQSGYYVLYVEDVCGSKAHDSVYITVHPLPQVSFVSDTVSGCEPLTVTFHPQISSPGQQYVWNFGDGSINQISFEQHPTHTFNYDGVYDITLTITSPNGCTNSVTYNDMIRVYPKPDARFTYTPQTVSIVKPEVIFTNLSTDADWYIWSFGDGDSSNLIHPYHWYKHLGVYLVELIAITQKGCKDTARSYVTVRPEYTFYAPTSISPDFDDLNDIFYVVGTGITSKNFKMYIYDRWGEIIYETDKYDPNDPAKYGWDGTVKNHKSAPPGTYVWLVKYTDPDNIQHEESGTVTVIK
ncbi:MAG: PKD domain-containing protein [Bacteroidales bacterium]|nr:PKD domain-containing protein [Bacteroidales bacterium]